LLKKYSQPIRLVECYSLFLKTFITNGVGFVRSRYRERPDYRVDLLARTNVMTAWLGETCLARGGACLMVDEQPGREGTHR
jgi:hypothetical protein